MNPRTFEQMKKTNWSYTEGYITVGGDPGIDYDQSSGPIALICLDHLTPLKFRFSPPSEKTRIGTYRCPRPRCLTEVIT